MAKLPEQPPLSIPPRFSAKPHGVMEDFAWDYNNGWDGPMNSHKQKRKPLKTRLNKYGTFSYPRKDQKESHGKGAHVTNRLPKGKAN